MAEHIPRSEWRKQVAQDPAGAARHIIALEDEVERLRKDNVDLRVEVDHLERELHYSATGDGSANEVPGCPGWHYGLVVRRADGSVEFDVQHDDGRRIEGLGAGRYRMTATARLMYDEWPSWEQAARDAIYARSGD